MPNPKRKNITPMKYPVGHEYAYRRDLLTLSKQLKLLLKKHLAPIVPDLVNEVHSHLDLPTGRMVRQDAWSDALKAALEKVIRGMFNPANDAINEMIALGPQIDEHNKAEWRKLIRSQYGVYPTKEEAGKYNFLLRRWAEANSRLIKDIPNKTISQIAKATIEALQSGKTVPDMTTTIYNIMKKATDLTDSRARLIARDQVAKLNGNFTKHRQTDAGITSYIWRTVGDERVRHTHNKAHGKLYSWTTPPEVTDNNHPGEDYQCRCWAEPVLAEYLEFQASLLEPASKELEYS